MYFDLKIETKLLLYVKKASYCFATSPEDLEGKKAKININYPLGLMEKLPYLKARHFQESSGNYCLTNKIIWRPMKLVRPYGF